MRRKFVISLLSHGYGFGLRRPKTVVILEAEFWYLLFSICTLRGARVIALNARISDRSFPKYYKMRWFYTTIIRAVRSYFMSKP